MKIETKVIGFAFVVIATLLILLAVGHKTPDLPPDYRQPAVPEGGKEGPIKLQEEPQEPEYVEPPKPPVKPTNPGDRVDQNGRPIGPYKASTFSSDVRFVTGEWSDDLLNRQFSLLKQIKGSEDIERPGAPAEGQNDDAIIEKLRSREKCDSLQRNVPWSREDLINELEYFVNNVYNNRPIKFNTYGMRLSHTFGCWFITRWLQPEIIIENGVHLGQSTWLLRQAAPNAKIYSHDPRADMKYWDKNTVYHVGGPGYSQPGYNAQSFIDFADMDWSFIKNKSSVLVLFDDHQSSWKRIQLSQKLGFKHLYIDDNWSPLQGDNYSAKQLCDESGGMAYRKPGFKSELVLACDNFHMADKFIPLSEHKENRQQLLDMLKVYYESPPVLFVPALMEYTKFGHTPSKDTSGIKYELPRPSNKLIKGFMENTISPPLVQSFEEYKRANLSQFPLREFYNYANFGYLQLK